MNIEDDGVTVRIHWKDLREVIEKVTYKVHKLEGVGYREVVPVIEDRQQLLELMKKWQDG